MWIGFTLPMLACRDIHHIIKEFGLKALPAEREEVNLVDYPLMDGQPRIIKNNGRKQEKREYICIFEAAKSLSVVHSPI